MGMDQGQPTPPHYHDSSEDEEYDFGTSFKQLVQQKTQLKKSAHSRTAKPRIKIASRDLWADDGWYPFVSFDVYLTISSGSNEATCHLDNDNLYFETARLKPVKVGHIIFMGPWELVCTYGDCTHDVRGSLILAIAIFDKLNALLCLCHPKWQCIRGTMCKDYTVLVIYLCCVVLSCG